MLKDLFQFNEIKTVIDAIKSKPEEKHVVFDNSSGRRVKFERARHQLDEFLEEFSKEDSGKESKLEEIKDIVKQICPNFKYDLVQVLKWYLRFCHMTFIGDVGLDFNLDPHAENSLVSHLLGQLSVYYGMENHSLVDGIIKAAKILFIKCSFTHFPKESESRETNPSDKPSTSKSNTVLSKNKIIFNFGLFAPTNFNKLELNEFSLSYTLNELEKLHELLSLNFLPTSVILDKQLKAKPVEMQLSRKLSDLISLLDTENNNYYAQDYTDVKLHGVKYKIIADGVVSADINGKQKWLPVEFKRGSIAEYMNDYDVNDPLGASSYSYTHIYSQVLRESIGYTARCGFIGASDGMQFILFHEVDDNFRIRGKEIVTPIDCQLFSIKRGFEFIQAVQFGLQQEGSDFIESVIQKSYVKEGTKTIIIPLYYDKLFDIFTTIDKSINTDGYSSLHGWEVNSKHKWKDEIQEDFKDVRIMAHEIMMLSKLSSSYSERWKVTSVDDYFKNLSVTKIFQGERYKYNSVVLKVGNDQKSYSVIKVFDPLFARVGDSLRTDLNSCYHNCFQQFVKEAYALRILQSFEFIAEVESIGILTKSGITDYSDQVDLKNINFSGFFIQTKFIEGSCLQDEQIKPSYGFSLIKYIQSMHKLGIMHCDLTPQNVIVTSDGNIKIIDFGWGEINLIRLQEDRYQQDEI